jgi:integrase
MSKYDAFFESLISSSSHPLFSRLRETSSTPFSEPEIIDMAQALLRNAPAKASITELIASLHERIASVSPDSRQHLQKKVSFSYPTPTNPFADGVSAPFALYSAAKRLLSQARVAHTAHNASASTLFLKLVLASIVDFQILHFDYIPALITSLNDQRGASLHPTITVIPLQLPYGKTANAENRLYIAAGEVATYLKTFLSHPEAYDLLRSLSEENRNSLPSKLQSLLLEEFDCPEIGLGGFTFQAFLGAVSTVAYTEMPPAVVAYRSRATVSHSLPPERLGRLAKLALAPFTVVTAPRQREDTSGDDEFQHEDRAPYLDPDWMKDLRSVVKKESVDCGRLQEMAKNSDYAQLRCVADYALYLSKMLKAASIYRFVFLIATRLIPRLEGQSPEHLTWDDWEELVEKVLDDDSFFHRKSSTDDNDRNAAGYSRPLVKALRHFILFSLRGREGVKAILQQLPTSGLVHVDANLYSVDEYFGAKRYLVGASPVPNTHQIEAAEVALILGYRCGLRRAEAAFLRLSDFDVDDHLHIRPWFLRKLKTPNAARDLPLRLLIEQANREEFEAVMRFVNGRRERALKSSVPEDEALLFCKDEDVRSPINFDKLLERISEAFQQSLGTDSFRFHHLRHSFANICLLRLWPGLHQIANHMLRGKAGEETRKLIATSDTFRKDLLHTDKVTGEDLKAIALLMGHGSAATTIEHYIHVLDWYRKPDRNQPS